MSETALSWFPHWVSTPLRTLKAKYEEGMEKWRTDHPISYLLLSPVVSYILMPVAIFIAFPFTLTITSAVAAWFMQGTLPM